MGKLFNFPIYLREIPNSRITHPITNESNRIFRNPAFAEIKPPTPEANKENAKYSATDKLFNFPARLREIPDNIIACRGEIFE